MAEKRGSAVVRPAEEASPVRKTGPTCPQPDILTASAECACPLLFLWRLLQDRPAEQSWNGPAARLGEARRRARCPGLGQASTPARSDEFAALAALGRKSEVPKPGGDGPHGLAKGNISYYFLLPAARFDRGVEDEALRALAPVANHWHAALGVDPASRRSHPITEPIAIKRARPGRTPLIPALRRTRRL